VGGSGPSPSPDLQHSEVRDIMSFIREAIDSHGAALRSAMSIESDCKGSHSMFALSTQRMISFSFYQLSSSPRPPTVYRGFAPASHVRRLPELLEFGAQRGVCVLELGRYRYSVSVFLKYWLKIANFWYTHLYLAPLLRVTQSEFHSRVHFWKTRMMSYRAMKKFDGKFGRFDTST